jgi:hypothetical protein
VLEFLYKEGKRNKRDKNRKRSHLADVIILYFKDPTDSTKIFFNLTSPIGRIAGYKINMQKLLAFLYISKRTM